MIIKTLTVALVFCLLNVVLWLLFNSSISLTALLLITTGNAVAAGLINWLNISKDTNKKTEEYSPFDPTLQIAHETLPILRSGLDEQTALMTAQIIQKIAEVPAVAITDRERVLAFLGVGCDKHQPGDRILTEATKQVIATGQYMVVQSTKQLNCPERHTCDCPLAAAVIVPLKNKDEVVGTIKLYRTVDGQIPLYITRLALGVSQLMGMQIELAELDRQQQLLTLAKLDALNAQINPHFFFNTLNTIIMYSRTNPDRARRLLIRLADFFRLTLKRRGHFLTLAEEMDAVHNYLVLEKARFGNKLRIVEDIDPDLLRHMIPVLCLQPLVENAVKHGITAKVGEGTVKIIARRENNHIMLSVQDDGVGIHQDKLHLVLLPGYGSGNGVGLSNVHERLKSLYGEDNGLRIFSKWGKGTSIIFYIPMNNSVDAVEGRRHHYEAQSANS